MVLKHSEQAYVFCIFFCGDAAVGTIPGSKKDSNIILMLHSEGVFYIQWVLSQQVWPKSDSKNKEKSFYHCNEFQ